MARRRRRVAGSVHPDTGSRYISLHFVSRRAFPFLDQSVSVPPRVTEESQSWGKKKIYIYTVDLNSVPEILQFVYSRFLQMLVDNDTYNTLLVLIFGSISDPFDAVELLEHVKCIRHARVECRFLNRCITRSASRGSYITHRDIKRRDFNRGKNATDRKIRRGSVHDIEPRGRSADHQSATTSVVVIAADQRRNSFLAIVKFIPRDSKEKEREILRRIIARP